MFILTKFVSAALEALRALCCGVIKARQKDKAVFVCRVAALIKMGKDA